MKKRVCSILTALALCLTLLPGTAWAAEGDPGVTITFDSNNPVTLEDGGIYVAATENKGIEKVDTAPGDSAYLAYNNEILTVHGAFEVTARVTINTNLTITGEAGSSLEVTGVGPAFQLCDNSAVILIGGVDFTAISSSRTIQSYGAVSKIPTFKTSNDYSGKIEIINTSAASGSPAVSYVALDLKSSASIAITGQVQYGSSYPSPESIVLKSNGNVTLSNVFWSTVPPLTVEGENIHIEQNGGPSVYYGGLLNITAKKDVTIVKGGTGTSATLAGSAVISAGGDVTISGGGVPVQAPYGGTGSLTVKNAKNVSIQGKTNEDNPSLLPVPVTFENCGNVTVTNNGDGEILKEGVTFTSDCSWQAISGGKSVTIPDGSWAYGGDVPTNTGYFLESILTPTCWKAGEGRMFYEPPAEGTPAKLTLDGAAYGETIYVHDGTQAVPAQLELKGENAVTKLSAKALTLTGDGDFTGILDAADAFTNRSTGILNAVVQCPSRTFTVYGNRSTTDFPSVAVIGSEGYPLTIANGATLTVPQNGSITIYDLQGLKNHGTIVNGGAIQISLTEEPQGTPNLGTIVNNGEVRVYPSVDISGEEMSAFIKALGLTGTGTVKVEKTVEDGSTVTESYTNSGLKLLPPAGTDGALDLSSKTTEEDELATEGYKWEVETDPISGSITSATLTLSEGFNATSVTLPDATVTIVTEGESRIGTLSAGSSPDNAKLTFSGTGLLTITEHVEISGAENSLTVDAGAEVVANNGISIGASGGVDSTVTVNGTLTVAQGSGTAAIYGGRVAIGDTGVLEVSGENGVELHGMTDDCSNLFTVTGNGRFTADCSMYNVRVQPSGSFPDGTTAEGAINLGDEYMPDGCEARLVGNQIKLVRTSDGEELTGPLTIHKNHTWETAWTQGETTHWHACAFAGCTGKQPGSEAAHFYRSCVCTVCGYRAPAGTPDSDSGSSGGSSGDPGDFSGSFGGFGDRDSGYAVTIEESSHGKVSSSRARAGSGSAVTLTVTPDSGYILDVLTVTDSRGNDVELTQEDGGRYTFTMPNRDVTVRASFISSVCTGGAGCPSRAFPDLDTGSWYHEAVDYVLRGGLMAGYTGGLFGPNDSLSRAQFAQILYNRAGRPTVTGSDGFTDTAPGAWYADAVAWAVGQGIVSGHGDGRFGPDDPITREQLAAILWRYAGRPASPDLLLPFSDADQISPWAAAPLRWAVERGIVSGKGSGVLDPQGTATRAEAAQMLKNFLEQQP